MEIQDIIISNKIIAKFMKYDDVDCYNCKYTRDCNWIQCGLTPQEKDEQLKYHSSWDWLMPVVEKIEDYGYIVYIKQEICYIRNKTNSIKNLVYMCHYPKITAVFMVVVEFIKWYNENKDNGK